MAELDVKIAELEQLNQELLVQRSQVEMEQIQRKKQSLVPFCVVK